MRKVRGDGNELKEPSGFSAAGRHLSKLFEGWMVATPDRRGFAGHYLIPGVGCSVPFDWNVTPADVTERVRAAIDD